MQEYRAKKKGAKKKVIKKDVERKAIHTWTDAIRQMEAAAIEKANKTADKIKTIIHSSK